VEAVTPAGIAFTHVETREVPVLSMEVRLRGGTAHDPVSLAGRARLAMGLLNEGAGPYNAQQFQQLQDRFGVGLGFDTGRDFISLSLSTLSANRAEAFELLRLAVREPRFEAKAVERVRAQLLSLIARAQESPGRMASQRLMAEIFPAHGYGRDGDGTAQSVQALTTAQLRDWMAARFLKNNLMIVTIGDATQAQVAALIDHAFATLPTGDAPALVAAQVVEGQHILIEREQPQTIVMFAAQGLLRDDPDFIPAFVLNHLLGGGGFGSRLMEEVREKRGLAYSVSTSLSPFQRAGIFFGQVASANDSAGQALDLIRAEMRKIAENGVDDATLNDAKTYLSGAYPLRFSSNAGIAGQMIGLMSQGIPLTYIDERNSLIEAVGQDDIRRVAKRLLRPDALSIVAVGQPTNFTLDQSPTE
ncbi:MAG: M16 family metallopeptidase, partial [Alphaproteobacteria bacterium]